LTLFERVKRLLKGSWEVSRVLKRLPRAPTGVPGGILGSQRGLLGDKNGVPSNVQNVYTF